MADEYELQKISDAQIAEKSALVRRIADNALRGLYKPTEYGRVFLPMTVIKRFHDCLAPTHDKVLEVAKKKACGMTARRCSPIARIRRFLVMRPWTLT